MSWFIGLFVVVVVGLAATALLLGGREREPEPELGARDSNKRLGDPPSAALAAVLDAAGFRRLDSHSWVNGSWAGGSLFCQPPLGGAGAYSLWCDQVAHAQPEPLVGLRLRAWPRASAPRADREPEQLLPADEVPGLIVEVRGAQGPASAVQRALARELLSRDERLARLPQAELTLELSSARAAKLSVVWSGDAASLEQALQVLDALQSTLARA